MTQHMILEKRNIGNPLFQRFCGWRENKNKRGATILSSAQPAWGGCGSACRSRYWKQMNLLCAAELRRERARKWEGNRKRLKNMAQPVLWEFKHIKTIKLCHLFWCTIAPCACLAQRGIDGWQPCFCYYIWGDKTKTIGWMDREMEQRWVGRDIKEPWNQIQSFVAFSPCA